MNSKTPKSNAARRQFIFDSSQDGMRRRHAGLGLGLYAKQSKALPALPCARPARCRRMISSAPASVAACASATALQHPRTGQAGRPGGDGTPYFTARNIPCEMCEDIPCVKACPTRRSIMG